AGSRHREMKLNVLLVGLNEPALMHGFRWLESFLVGCSESCGEWAFWIRDFCPPDPELDPEEGVYRLDEVALIEGPTWESPVTPRSGCVIRRASFTIAAGDPCMYSPPSELDTDQVAVMDFDYTDA